MLLTAVRWPPSRFTSALEQFSIPQRTGVPCKRTRRESGGRCHGRTCERDFDFSWRPQRREGREAARWLVGLRGSTRSVTGGVSTSPPPATACSPPLRVASSAPASTTKPPSSTAPAPSSLISTRSPPPARRQTPRQPPRCRRRGGLCRHGSSRRKGAGGGGGTAEGRRGGLSAAERGTAARCPTFGMCASRCQTRSAGAMAPPSRRRSPTTTGRCLRVRREPCRRCAGWAPSAPSSSWLRSRSTWTRRCCCWASCTAGP
mmetsp:Transcript_9792/g.32653  ORF Transcript_9792/g.32653 Transcript_9792/m.32653 type:complete len:260 (-) Transcript_9792:821-1600(-)